MREVQSMTQTGRTALDPVCGMKVDLDHPKGGKLVYQGREYGFCSSRCRDKFQGDPQKYLARRSCSLKAPRSLTLARAPREHQTLGSQCDGLDRIAGRVSSAL